ncbi:MAG: hypothetical protein ABIV25_00750 [Paracoccaceae bacterium]
MNISRAFLILGSIWILVGIPIGMYMGPTQDITLMPLHAHINLVGFVLSSIFGLVYLAKLEMAANILAQAHFWLHLVGSVVLLPFLFLLLSGRMAEATAGPIMGIGEGLITLGIIAYLINLLRNG